MSVPHHLSSDNKKDRPTFWNDHHDASTGSSGYNNDHDDDEFDDDALEMAALVPSSLIKDDAMRTTATTVHRAHKSSRTTPARISACSSSSSDWLGKLGGVLLLIVTLAVVSNYYSFDDDDKTSAARTSAGGGSSSSDKKNDLLLHAVNNFSCPSPTDFLNGTTKKKDYLEEGDFNLYDPDPEWEANFDNFIQNFRSQSFDGWSWTYTEFKEIFTDFKRKYFLPFLKSGDSIYESACGIGLNLFGTLEILQEYGNVTNVTVYGNEYLLESAKHASQVLDALLLPPTNITTSNKNKLGQICQGDSADLSFVPANSFDLVFTGYITPHPDPLGQGGGFGEIDKRLKQNCVYLSSSTKTSRFNVHHDKKVDEEKIWKASKIRDIMQERQNDWFSDWFHQMIRIAKPGAPVIVEEVAPPLCQKPSDWGGVTKDFWKQGVEKYGWDVDPSTLRFGSRKNALGEEARYHVFFLKNPASEKDKLQLPPP